MIICAAGSPVQPDALIGVRLSRRPRLRRGRGSRVGRRAGTPWGAQAKAYRYRIQDMCIILEHPPDRSPPGRPLLRRRTPAHGPIGELGVGRLQQTFGSAGHSDSSPGTRPPRSCPANDGRTTADRFLLRWINLWCDETLFLALEKPWTRLPDPLSVHRRGHRGPRRG